MKNEKEQININEKRTALQEDLVKIAAGDAPLMILEKELMDMVDISTMEDGRNFCQKSSKDTN